MLLPWLNWHLLQKGTHFLVSSAYCKQQFRVHHSSSFSTKLRDQWSGNQQDCYTQKEHRDLVLQGLDQASQKSQTPSSKASVKHLNAYLVFLLHSASFSSKSKGNPATGLLKWLFQITQIRCNTCWSHVAARTVLGYFHFSRFKHLSLDNKGTALHR